MDCCAAERVELADEGVEFEADLVEVVAATDLGTEEPAMEAMEAMGLDVVSSGVPADARDVDAEVDAMADWTGVEVALGFNNARAANRVASAAAPA